MKKKVGDVVAHCDSGLIGEVVEINTYNNIRFIVVRALIDRDDFFGGVRCTCEISEHWTKIGVL